MGMTMTTQWFPLTKTLDTMESVDVLSVELLTFHELRNETRRYVVGERSAHYPVPSTLDVADMAVVFSHNAEAMRAITVRYFKARLRF